MGVMRVVFARDVPTSLSSDLASLPAPRSGRASGPPGPGRLGHLPPGPETINCIDNHFGGTKLARLERTSDELPWQTVGAKGAWGRKLSHGVELDRCAFVTAPTPSLPWRSAPSALGPRPYV